jgi:ankyrin repeat protein
MRNITKEKLAPYIETNIEYYDKYREKFNKKNNFLSWNWSFFFFIPWLAYRKIWGYYFVYFFMSIVFSITFYNLIIDASRISPIFMIIFGLSSLIFIAYSMLTVNNQVLKQASEVKDNASIKSKSSWVVVFFATLLLLLPSIYAAKSLYPVFKFHEDRNSIFHFPSDETNIQTVLDKINEISDENVNAIGVYAEIGIMSKKDLIDIVVCYDNVMLLDRLKEKGTMFFESHLKNAVRCNALKSVTFLLDQDVRSIGKEEKDDFNNFSKYRLVQRAIYKENLSMAKLLLSKEKHIMGANAQVLIMDAFSIKDPIKKKEFIEYLLNKKIDIYNTLETNETSALREAVANNDYNMTKLLLKHGANPNQHYAHSRTPLHTSLYNADIKIMKLLLEYKGDVNDVLYDGLTLLNHALRNNNTQKFKLLLDNNATLDVKDFINRYASGSTDATNLELLYKYYTMPVLEKKEIVALFQKACELKSTKAIDILLSKGYDINTTSSNSAYPYVAHVCYGWKDMHMFEYVLAKGANVNVYTRGNDNGRNLLQNIISHNSEKVFTPESWKRLKLVLAHGANINHQNDGNRTALIAVDTYPDVMLYLLDHTNVDITLLDDRNKSLLHYSDNKPEVMQQIIHKIKKDTKLEYLIDQKNMYGNTPLHYAVETSDAVTKILLKAGANTNILNDAGFSVVGGVQTKEAYELLKDTGNDISRSKAKCTIFVKQMGKKEYQKECLLVAKNAKELNDITYYQFLGGDIKNLVKTTYDLSRGKREYIYAYSNVGHGHVIHKEFDKAKKSYAEFLSLGWSCNLSEEKSDALMKSDMEIISKLYGEKYKKEALKIWEKVKYEYRNK